MSPTERSRGARYSRMSRRRGSAIALKASDVVAARAITSYNIPLMEYVKRAGEMMGQRIEINGVNTWYEARGTGETVVLLHGGLTDSRDFAGNLAALADRFHCVFP